MTAGVTMALTGLTNGTTVNLLGDVTFGVRLEVVSCFPPQSLKMRIATGQDRFSRLELPAPPESLFSMVAGVF